MSKMQKRDKIIVLERFIPAVPGQPKGSPMLSLTEFSAVPFDHESAFSGMYWYWTER
ncbi:hypothetical protein SLT67_10930 [Paenibacillus illinoisensis]|uniref:hypothetical protein n=1 Tax=Paenibacillus illinoisensis TaxID=59845 RepID=UPI003CE97226